MNDDIKLPSRFNIGDHVTIASYGYIEGVVFREDKVLYEVLIGDLPDMVYLINSVGVFTSDKTPVD